MDSPQRLGAWSAIDLHVHSSVGSNDTDGLSSIDEIASVAIERGLSMVVITDHSNSAGSMDCGSGDVEDCPNQGPEFPALAEVRDSYEGQLELAVGVEISPVASLEITSEPTGHIGCIPPSLHGFQVVMDPVIDRPVGTIPGSEGIEWCNEKGGFSVVNHPFTLAGWLNYDWSSMNYDAIEVFNGGARFDSGDWDSVQSWACDISSGKNVVAVGGSDTHRAQTPTPPDGPLDQAMGFPTTWVWRANDSDESLLDALRHGRTVVADPRTRLDVWAQKENMIAGPGERIVEEGGEVSLHVEVEVEHAGLKVEIVDLFTGACIEDNRSSQQDRPMVEPTVLHAEPLVPGAPVSRQYDMAVDDVERIVVWVRPIEPITIGHDGFAISSPIFIGNP